MDLVSHPPPAVSLGLLAVPPVRSRSAAGGFDAAFAFNLFVLCGIFACFFQVQWSSPALFSHEIYIPTKFWDGFHFHFLMNQYHGTFESILAAPFIWGFGLNQGALRAIPFFYSLVAIGIFYWLSVKVYGSRLWGFGAAWLLVISPVFVVGSGAGVFHATPMFTVILASLAFLFKWSASGDVRHLIATACLAALALGMRTWSHAFLASVGLGIVALGGLRSLPRARLTHLSVSAVIVAACSPFWVVCAKWWKGDYAILKTGSAISRWLENRASFADGFMAVFQRHYLALRQHLDGTFYVNYAVDPMPKGRVAEVIFWACFGLGTLMMLRRRDRRASERASLTPYAAFPLYFALTLASKLIFDSKFSNHLFPVCFLVPFIVLGPFWMAERSALIPRRVALWGAALAVLAITVDQGRLLIGFRQKLLETGGRTGCSLAIPELAAFARREAAGRLFLGRRNWDSSDVGSVHHYSGGDVDAGFLNSLNEGQRLEGAFVSLYTEQRATPAELFWKIPGSRERVFYSKDGRPQFVFHSLKNGAAGPTGAVTVAAGGGLDLSARLGGTRFPADSGSKASGYFVRGRGDGGDVLYVQESDPQRDSPSPHSIWAALGTGFTQVGRVSIDRNGVGVKFLEKSASGVLSRADALFVCPSGTGSDGVAQTAVLRVDLRAPSRGARNVAP